MVRQKTTSWVGWVYFASALMALLGGLQIISGLTAIFHDEFFIVTQDKLIALDFTTWGWINLLIGLGVVTVGISLAIGKTWAQIVALILTVVSALASIAFLPAYPLWSIASLVIAGLVLYAIAMHGDEVTA